jgi:predicted hotdog family 3-hydroxylacyl-ACP dehydratase
MQVAVVAQDTRLLELVAQAVAVMGVALTHQQIQRREVPILAVAEEQAVMRQAVTAAQA